MAGTWKIDVAGLLGKVGNRKDVDIDESLDELGTSASAVPADQTLAVRGRLEAIEGNRIVLEASILTSWQGACRRCLLPVNGDIATSVREIYEPAATEGETYPIDGTRVEIDAVVREAVMLELPDAPICKQDCAGLCPSCGVNRNEAKCDCRTEVLDPRWAALDQLKSD